MTAHSNELEARLRRIAQRISPCPAPDVAEGWNLCAHGLPWPCPSTEAAWIARGLDREQQVRDAVSWLRGQRAEAYAGASSAAPTVGESGSNS